MPSSRIDTTKRARIPPPDESKLGANLQESGGRDGGADPRVPNETLDLALSYGPAGMPRRSVLLVTRREVVLSASGFVLLGAISDPSGQEPWADGTLWRDGQGWVAWYGRFALAVPLSVALFAAPSGHAFWLLRAATTERHLTKNQ